MQSTGLKVQCTPVAAASTAVTRAACSIRSGSQDDAMPSWVGKIVAPSKNECPWMQSSPTRSGMRSRVCSTRSWASFSRLGEVCRIDPTCLRRMSPS